MIVKDRALKSVAVRFDLNMIAVEWTVKIKEDGLVIAATEEANSYTQDRREQLAADVEGAENYIAAIGW